MTTTTTTTCDLCTRPVGDTAYACPACAAGTVEQLRAVVAVAGEVETTIARLARYSDRHGRPSLDDDPEGRPDGGLRPTPLPVDLAARDRADEAMTTIVTWARHCAEERGGGPMAPGAAAGPLCRAGAGCRHDSCAVIRERSVPHPVARAASYLLGQIDWLRHRPEAAEALDDLTQAGATLVRLVDAPPPLWYAGPCWAVAADADPCPEELYARSDAGTVRCPACKTRHDVGERRKWLLDEADQVLAHAALVAAALSRLGQQVTASSVRNLAARGRIAAHGQDERGRPLYRVGEVRAVVEDIAHARLAGVAA